MNKEQTIELAKQAGWTELGADLWGATHDGAMSTYALQRFAALVRADTALEAGPALVQECGFDETTGSCTSNPCCAVSPTQADTSKQFAAGIACAANLLEAWINNPVFSENFNAWTDRDAFRIIADWPKHLKELAYTANIQPVQEPEISDAQASLLASALGECILASGIVGEDKDGFSGPELLMFAEDLKQMLERSRQPAQEPRSALFRYLDQQVAKDMAGFYTALGLEAPAPQSRKAVKLTEAEIHNADPMPHGMSDVFAELVLAEHTAALEAERTARIAAQAQRDELLAAMTGLLAYFESGNCVPVSQATIKANSAEVLAARAAIAKSEGGAA